MGVAMMRCHILEFETRHTASSSSAAVSTGFFTT